MRRIRATVVLLAVAYLLGSALAGCSRAAHRSVVIIPRLTSDARWLSLHVGVAEAVERAGLEAHWSGPSEDSNAAEQIELAESAIEQRAYGIVLEPSALVATNKVIRKAQSQRIPVVLVADGAGMPEGEHIYRVSSDTNAGGALIAQRINQIVHGDGEVAILGLRSEIPGNIERADAISEALRRLDPNLQVVKKSMESSSISYEQRGALEFIRNHPRLKAIVALNTQESYAAVGAVRASNATDRIKIIGCDQSMAIFLMLRNGALDALLIQDLRQIGRTSVELIANDRAGKRASAVTVVKPFLITASNIDDEPMQQAILMHREAR